MNDRTRRPTLTPEDDPSIPVLTERLTLPVSTSRQAAPAAAVDTVVDGMVFPNASPAALPDADAIRNAVLDDLTTRLPREIESLMRRQLAGSIEAAVQAASTDLAARVRNAAAQSLQTLVEQAVKAEIARLRLPPPPK
jgi:hypothetical protein